MKFAEIMVIMWAGGFVIAVIALVVHSIFFRKVIKYYSKYSDGVDIGVSSNDELYEWVILRSAGNLKPQKAPYGITLDGYHFAVDSKNKVRASLPQFRGERLSFGSFTEVSEINSIFDRIVKMSSPDQMNNDSANKRAITWQRTNNIFYTITNIALIILGVSTLMLLLTGLPDTYSNNSPDDQYKYGGNEVNAETNVESSTKIELSDFLDMSEDELVKKMNFKKNEEGFYPEEGINYMFSIHGGKVWSARLTESMPDAEKYTIAGIKIGDRFTDINLDSQYLLMSEHKDFYDDNAYTKKYLGKETRTGLEITYSLNDSRIIELGCFGIDPSEWGLSDEDWEREISELEAYLDSSDGNDSDSNASNMDQGKTEDESKSIEPLIIDSFVGNWVVSGDWVGGMSIIASDTQGTVSVEYGDRGGANEWSTIRFTATYDSTISGFRYTGYTKTLMELNENGEVNEQTITKDDVSGALYFEGDKLIWHEEEYGSSIEFERAEE